MRRKANENAPLLPGMEDADEMPDTSEATPKPARQKAKPRTRRLTRFRVIAGSIALVLLTTSSVYAFHMAEDFLIRDPRFTVSTSTPGDAEPSILVSGAVHASVDAIQSVFSGDAGNSLYLVPLKDRLPALRAVSWVHDAAIARIWPNRIMVRIVERTPVAFITLPSARPALIDAEGVILPSVSDKFDLPVLRGVKPSQPLEVRRESVRRMLHIIEELGPAIKDISEIDITDPGNAAVSRPYQGRMLKLMLGDTNLAARYNNFVTHFGEIQNRVPNAKTLDLRLETQITVLDSVAP
jgi:cell division protein FtsQ